MKTQFTILHHASRTCEMTEPVSHRKKGLALLIRLLWAAALVLPVLGAQAGVVFQPVEQTNSTLSLTWSTEAGGKYQLQFNSDLCSTNWTNLGSLLTATGAALSVTDSVTNAQRRFYRVVLSTPPVPDTLVIQSLRATGVPAAPNGVVVATVSAQSSQGLALNYLWTVSTGWSIASGATSSVVTIIAPNSYTASGTATVTVTDTQNASAVGATALSTLDDSDFTWVDVTTNSVQAVPNTGYLADSASQVTITLPASAALGDVVRVSGVGAGGWMIAQNAGQTVVTRDIEAIDSVWTEANTPPDASWMCSVASSADGTKLVAGISMGGIITSWDSGSTWTLTSAPLAYEYSVASSADGTKLVAASGGIVTSSDAGVTWSLTSAPHDPYTSVASSADGTKLVAVEAPGWIFTSSDAGATWKMVSGPALNWASVASSADGTKLVAALMDGGIYTSSDAGVSWIPTSAPAGSWVSVASSADGTKLVASGDFGLYTSSDSGATWIQRFSYFGGAVASSADGTKLVEARCVVFGPPRTGGYVSTSVNSGVTWILAPVGGDWSAVASSADGTKLVAAAGGGGIYTSRPTAVPSTTIGTEGAIIGGQYDAVELQYVGNGTFMVLSNEGYLVVQ